MLLYNKQFHLLFTGVGDTSTCGTNVVFSILSDAVYVRNCHSTQKQCTIPRNYLRLNYINHLVGNIEYVPNHPLVTLGAAINVEQPGADWRQEQHQAVESPKLLGWGKLIVVV